jgi:hypothetical protein
MKIRNSLESLPHFDMFGCFSETESPLAKEGA